MNQLDYTSEHVDPHSYQSNLNDYLIFLMHQRTYEFVSQYIENKTVLDLGCGEGYGDNILANDAKQINAVDISSDVIEAARKKYTSNKINFSLIKPIEEEPLPFKEKTFDVVVSFQVIEHIPNSNEYLREIKRILKPGGTFILSTPNARTRLLPFQNPWNKFHLREYTAKELKETLSQEFKEIELYGLSLREPWLSREKGRTKRNKWLLYPFTNKLIPNGLRQWSLHNIWNLTQGGRRNSKTGVRSNAYPSPEDAIVINENIEYSPSLIGVCHN